MKAAKLLLAAAFALAANAAFAQTVPSTSVAPGQSTNANDQTQRNTPTMNAGTPTSEPMGDRMNPNSMAGQGDRKTMRGNGSMRHKGMKHKTSMSDGSGKMKTKM